MVGPARKVSDRHSGKALRHRISPARDQPWEGAGALSNVEGIPASSSKRKKKKKRKNLTKSKKKDKYNGSDAGEVGKEPSTIKKKKCSINERKR